MRNKFKVKILLVVLVFLLLASGIFLATTKFRSGSDNSGSATVSPVIKATDSAKLNEEPKKEESAGETEGATQYIPLKNYQPTETLQQNTQTSKPDESGKIATLNSLIEKLAKLAVKIWGEDEKIRITTQGWFDAIENCANQTGIPYGDCIELKNAWYKPLLDSAGSNRKAYLSDYRNYESQATQIMAGCSSACQSIWNNYLQSLKKNGIPEP